MVFSLKKNRECRKGLHKIEPNDFIHESLA